MTSLVDHDRLERLIERARTEGTSEDDPMGLHLAVALLHRGEIIADHYGTTADAATPLISWSMAKSVTHALVGFLVHDGLLELHAPAPVPGWADDERSAITLHQLLQMNSGLAFVEDYVDDQVSDVIEMLFGEGQHDVAAYAASKPLAHPPGTVFNYSSGTSNIVAAICGRVIREHHGTDVGAFLDERLFSPLGMNDTTIRTDTAGTFIGSSFVYATAPDFLRFGQLYLDDGIVDGARILPEGWVAHARTPVSTPVPDGHWYGAHWWLWDSNCDPSTNGTGFEVADINGFGAHGYEGQYTVVVPDRDLVVVRLGKTDTDRQPGVRAWIADLIRCVSPSSPSPSG